MTPLTPSPHTLRALQGLLEFKHTCTFLSTIGITDERSEEETDCFYYLLLSVFLYSFHKVKQESAVGVSFKERAGIRIFL